MLIEGESEEISQLRENFEIKVPIMQVTVDNLKKELQTSIFPFGFLVSPEGQVLAKGLIFGMEQLKLLISNSNKSHNIKPGKSITFEQ